MSNPNFPPRPRSCRLLGGAALILLALAGCQRESTPIPVPGEGEVKAQAPAKQESEARKDPAAPVSAQEQERLHQPFKDAVLLEPVEGELLLDLTCTGKNVAKLYEAVAGKANAGGLWDQVRFVSPEGKRLKYKALVTTDLGEVQIDLYPDAAPNHVRNFIALARAGYFDGLPIYRSVRETEGDMTAFLEAGCPKGTGDVGFGSIGYWLKPEIEGNKLTHEEGAVGAWHRQELETAACRFYITAEKMPQMDGAFTLFGKVTRGLDVVRTINSRPVDDKVNYRLKEPVPIRTVVIQVQDEGNTATLHAN